MKRVGWLIVNEFLNTTKYTELYEWLQEACTNQHITLLVKTNAEVLCSDYEKELREAGISFILFWDKDIRLAQLLEQTDIPVFNSARAIEMCDDKAYSYLQLKKHGIVMPKTILAPKT